MGFNVPELTEKLPELQFYGGEKEMSVFTRSNIFVLFKEAYKAPKEMISE